MSLGQVFHFHVACKGDTAWSITFVGDGDKVQIGLHWRDKLVPTHTAHITKTELRRMTDILCPGAK